MAGDRVYGNIIVDGASRLAGPIFLGKNDTPGTERVITIAGSETNIGVDIDLKGSGILRAPSGYEANILSESRALVNRAYADGYLAGKIIPTPGASEDGKVPSYVHSSGDMVWVTPSGGGGGSVTFGTAGQIPIVNSGGTDFEYSSGLSFSGTNSSLTVAGIRIHSRGSSTTNIFIGAGAGNFTSTGTENTSVGATTLEDLTSGLGNTIIGYFCGNSITTGSANTLIGRVCGPSITTTSNNTLIGQSVGNILIGSGNTFIGNATGSTVTSGNTNTIIGAGSDVPTPTGSGQLSIQNIIYGTGNSSSGANISTGSIGIGTRSPARRLHIEQNTATTNAVTYVHRLTSTSSGTPAIGIGVGIEFEVETSASNNEVGATIEAVTTNVTGTTEAFDLVISTMTGGSAATERLRINDSGISIPAAAAYYVGPVATNGSWRFIISGDDLLLQQRESGSYVTKQTFSGA
jgi:hypothetical protein